MDRDDYDYEDDMPAGHVMCPRCDGHRTVDCHCGGDLCVCENYGVREGAPRGVGTEVRERHASGTRGVNEPRCVRK
jgi:hypothetical protein